MKKFILLLSFLMTTSLAFAVGTWTSQNYVPQSVSFQAIFFADSNNGWVVGAKGTILKTTDGGEIWNACHSSTTNTLNDVYFYDVNNGIVLGDAGTILTTTDGGTNWGHSTLGNADLMSFNKINSLNYWMLAKPVSASAVSPYCLRTTDAGNGWTIRKYDTLIYNLPKNDTTFYVTGWLQNFYFVDSANGWAVGYKGISNTVNAGKTWTPKAISTGTFYDVYFTSKDTGWVVGQGGTIVKTIDRGSMWTTQKSNVTSNLMKVKFLNKNLGFVLSANNEILKTTDGGENWAVKLDQQSYKYTNDIFFLSDSVYYGACQSGITTKTNDAGETWNFSTNTVTKEQLSKVHFIDANHGWIAGGSNEILRTSNAGVKWEKYTSEFSDSYNDIHFVNQYVGWVSGIRSNEDGDYGIVLKTTDGGISWNTSDSVRGQFMYKLSVINESTVLVVGDGGYILKTTNGGKSWEKKTSNIVRSIYAISFADALNGIVVGVDGLTLKTTDGGDSWSGQNSGISYDLVSVDYKNPSLAWAVGVTGHITKTTNGGSTWTPVTINTVSYDMYQVSFYSDSIGWIAGAGGQLLSTIDAGSHWYGTILPSKNSIYGISFVHPGLGWAVGDMGLLYKYYDDQYVPTAVEDEIISMDNNVISAGPNPSSSYINANFNIASSGYAKIALYNTLGEAVVIVKDGYALEGAFNSTIDVANLPSGAYLLVLESNGKKISKNISIVK